eukprot:COSAG04_NODE_1614_length_6164_cov_66.962737_8_plen_61_part_01
MLRVGGAARFAAARHLAPLRCGVASAGAPGAPARNMRVLVGVKRVIDYAVKIRVKADQSGV